MICVYDGAEQKKQLDKGCAGGKDVTRYGRRMVLYLCTYNPRHRIESEGSNLAAVTKSEQRWPTLHLLGGLPGTDANVWDK